MDAASEGDVPWALLVARLTAVTAFVAAMLLRRAPLVVRSAQLPAIASIGVLIVGADSMYAISSTMGLLSVVAVLSSLYPVVTVALARVYLHEGIERLRQIGIAACLSGVAAISGATGDGIAEMHPHEAKQQQVTDVRIEKQLAAEDQKTLIQRARGGVGSFGLPGTPRPGSSSYSSRSVPLRRSHPDGGIAQVAGNYLSKGDVGEKAAWFRDSEGSLLVIGQPMS